MNQYTQSLLYMASSHIIRTDVISSFLVPAKCKSSLEDPRDISYRNNKYLTRLLVFRNPQTDVHQLSVSDVEPHFSQTTNTGSKKRNEKIDGSHDEVNDKIEKALTLLTLRDQRNLIQFWSPSQVGKHKLLVTVDQPFGIGIHDEGLFRYRKESERNWFYVDEECEEEDLVPVVRVFRRRLPEWTSDISNYNLKNHPLRDSAMCWDLHGYLVLPVFDSTTTLCVGVLECITSSKYLDCAYEVQEIHRALKAAKLTSPQAFDSPTCVDDKNREAKLDEIFRMLKDVCEMHKLPLAQTWIVSSRNSLVVNGRNMEMTCSSFKSSCMGKVCISTSGLPFYVHDLHFWKFREACSEHHLLKSKGVVGRALASHGSCFCADVTKLEEDEYSLVHFAHMNRLTSCFSISLHSVEHDDTYVLEFFLPVNMKESAKLQNLVQNLKLHVKLSSFKLVDPMSTEVIGLPMAVSQQSSSMQLHIIQTSLPKEVMHVDSKESETAGESNTQNDYINVQDQCDFGQVSHKNRCNAITSTGRVPMDDATSNKVNGDKGACMRQRRKSQGDLTSEHIQNYFGKSTDEISISFGSLSTDIVPLDSQTIEESTDQIDCMNAQDEHEGMPVDDATSNKIIVVNGETGYNSGAKGASTDKGKSNYLILQDKSYRKSVGEVSTFLGSLSRYKLHLDPETVRETSDQIDCTNGHGQCDFSNSCQKSLNISITNTEETSADDDVIGKKIDVVAKGKKYNSGKERGSNKRRRKSKMDSITTESIQKYFGKPIEEASRGFGVSRSTLKRVCRKLNIPNWPMPHRNKKYAHIGIYVVVLLLVKVKRWSCSSNRHGFSGKWWICGKHNAFVPKSSPPVIQEVPPEGMTTCRMLNVSESLKELQDFIETPTTFLEPPQARLVQYQESLEKNVVSVSDTKMVTVKATFKDDIIKFQTPISSPLLELKDQVSQRIKLNSSKLHLKYMDEDNDMILIACDADLRNLMPFSATQVSKHTIKLIVQMVGD